MLAVEKTHRDSVRFLLLQVMPCHLQQTQTQTRNAVTHLRSYYYCRRRVLSLSWQTQHLFVKILI
jgi:hypothetical protein